jgi:lysyl-tRNA synthetase class I
MGRSPSKIECENCGRIKYGYMDKRKSKFYICYSCGSYNGQAAINLMEKILYQPLLLLEMIKNGELTKI